MVMKLSSIDRRNIDAQRVMENGDLLTTFEADVFPLEHPAGSLICRAVSGEECTSYDSDDLMSMTVTRLGCLFWDEGEFTPDGDDVEYEPTPLDDFEF